MKPYWQEPESEADVAVNRASVWSGLGLLALLIGGLIFFWAAY